MLDVFASLAAFLAAVLSVRGHTWDDTKTGRLKYTWKGVLAMVIATAAFIFSIRSAHNKSIEQQVQTANQQAHLGVSKETKDYVKEQLRVLDDHTNKLGETLGYSQRLTKRQEEQVQESQRMSNDLEAQLSLLSSLSEAQSRQHQLSQKLTAQQQEQVRLLVQMRLDRELVGVEISFKPSTDHWLRIAEVIKAAEVPKKAGESRKALEPPSQGVSYSDAPILADRVGRYWDIRFGPIYKKEGSIQPPPVSTESPEYKAFDDVIVAALAELFIDWGGRGGEDAETIISANGHYPSAVKISKDEIAFILRPPKLRLILGDLYNNSNIKLRSKRYPASLKFRSLDYRVKFDDEIQMGWVRKKGESHLERWMPYVSGTHHLKIDWSLLLR